ncbi:ABC transporter [Ruminococcaceae bacterium BL-6]|jgi:ABC-2 type transport system permease protein|nr:ABC transporter [Ruminococcaceae bacterium BL-6]HBC27633.1 ABC transporter [Oscillospiraceae bacterium]
MKAIYKRELRSYFASPIGYVCIAILLALFGFYYYLVMQYRSTSYISSVYSTMFIWCMMVVPILTMRSMSDDQRNKTDQALLTAPVGVTGIVLGKFFACFTVFAVAILGSLLPAVVLSFVSSLKWVTVLGTVLGALFYGGAMIAIGVFISSLTQSQIIAAIGTFGASMFLLIIDQLSGTVTDPVISKVITWISFNSRYRPFTNGVFNISSIVFFLSIMAVFVFLTARRLESKRWS